MKSFNVIEYDFNSRKFVQHDIMPYLIDCYKRTKPKDRPKTVDEFKEFIKKESMYQFWSRCEYEIILSDVPCQRDFQKIDVHYQIMMNIDIITDVLIENLKK